MKLAAMGLDDLTIPASLLRNDEMGPHQLQLEEWEEEDYSRAEKLSVISTFSSLVLSQRNSIVDESRFQNDVVIPFRRQLWNQLQSASATHIGSVAPQDILIQAERCSIFNQEDGVVNESIRRRLASPAAEYRDEPSRPKGDQNGSSITASPPDYFGSMWQLFASPSPLK